jgi:hypothetical protein
VSEHSDAHIIDSELFIGMLLSEYAFLHTDYNSISHPLFQTVKTIPFHRMADDEEVQALVVDNGSGMCKVFTFNSSQFFEKGNCLCRVSTTVVAELKIAFPLDSFHVDIHIFSLFFILQRLVSLAMMPLARCSPPLSAALNTLESWWAWTRRTRMSVTRLNPSVASSPSSTLLSTAS